MQFIGINKGRRTPDVALFLLVRFNLLRELKLIYNSIHSSLVLDVKLFLQELFNFCFPMLLKKNFLGFLEQLLYVLFVFVLYFRPKVASAVNT